MCVHQPLIIGGAMGLTQLQAPVLSPPVLTSIAGLRSKLHARAASRPVPTLARCDRYCGCAVEQVDKGNLWEAVRGDRTRRPSSAPSSPGAPDLLLGHGPSQVAPSSVLLLVPAEAEPHRRQHLLGEVVFLAGAEAGEQRRGQHLGRRRLPRSPLRPSSGPRRNPRRGRRSPRARGSLASAMAERSSSQEVTTEPRRQTSAMSATLSSKRSPGGSTSAFLLSRMLKPSA